MRGRVPRLGEVAQDLRDAESGGVDDRDRAERRVAHDGGVEADELDAPRPGQRRDRPQDVTVGQADGNDARLGVGGDEGDGRPAGERAARAQREREPDGGHDERTPVHLLPTRPGGLGVHAQRA
jgi:hypothetical protein